MEAYIVSSMSTIMSTFDAKTKAVRDKMICINEFVRTAKLSPNLAKRVRSYFEFKLSHSQRAFLMCSQYNSDEILCELSSNLRAEILLFLEDNLVSNIPFFKGKVPQFIADTISMFQPMVFQKGDFIVKENTQADEMFFLVKGRAGIYYGNNFALAVEQGSYFGEIGCIMGGIRRAGVKALELCEVQALSRRNLNILLCEYPDVAEELQRIAKDRETMVQAEKSSGVSPQMVEQKYPIQRNKIDKDFRDIPQPNQIQKREKLERTVIAPQQSNIKSGPDFQSSISKQTIATFGKLKSRVENKLK